MARSLPLENPAEAIVQPANAAETLGGTVTVYDPAMCCSTGVCGAGADPALLEIARDLRWLEKHGATVERFGLAQQPDAFVSSPRVAGLMQAFGNGALPAVLVNGDVLCYGRYPSRSELAVALSLLALAPASSGGPSHCCTPDSGCC